ncbi:hypothetical protein N7467_005712 [Penicillium canescens]|nr:hypothetical protein N7467_005712 [Penicillium canescens]
MRFLCLHGSLSSGSTFDAQLGPLQQNLAADNAASFYFINAQLYGKAPEGNEGFFGPPPHYRWLDYQGVETEALHQSVRGARGNSDAPAEELLSEMIPVDITWANHKDIMEYLDKKLEENPDIEGICGYSEGASIASTYILHEQKMEQEHSRPRRIKCGIFFTGLPPIDEKKGYIFADQREEMVDIQSIHVIGAADPFRCGADSLYNVCDPDTAQFFDTGKGHTVPRSGPIITELGDAIREMIQRAKEE